MIEYLRVLWEKGVDLDDAYMSDNFKMCAMLFFIINNFPVYGNLSGYNVKGDRACLKCEDDTCSHQLKYGSLLIETRSLISLQRLYPRREFIKDNNTLILSLGRTKNVPWRKLFGKRGWCFLIFHIGLASI